MRIAVLTLTRDRLETTQHCFSTLHEHSGCGFDHYVLDNGSQDGTVHWLTHDYDCELYAAPNNMGISRGMNLLLDEMVNPDDYDVIVKIDNDCELTTPGTLRDVCELVMSGGCLLSPTIKGLRQPPPILGELRIGDEVILNIPQIGGIFLAAPAWVYEKFRYSSDNPYWGLDDVEICSWWRGQGGTCGYVKRLDAWHHMTTDGQHDRYPSYFERKVAEGAPA